MRILWLAAADARGHLMRAHLMRGLLAREGVDVTVITTSEEGRAFLAVMGTPAEILSRHFGVAFDARQNMDRERTEACLLRYLLRPDRGSADLGRLAARAEGAAYVVNDFHPLLLVASSGAALPCPVVHVYGENLWRAIEGHFHGRRPAVLGRGYGAAVRALRDRAHARVEHTLGVGLAGEHDRARRSYRLPPVIAAPRRAPAAVRAALGVAPRERLAAVYLNPHFADPAVAVAIEGALRAEGLHVHAVGEGYAGRAGWRPQDPSFVDVAAAADLLISAPGMGAVGQARLLGVPFLALVTDQPEQRENLRFLSGVPTSATVALEGDGPLGPRLRAALAGLAAASPPALARPSAGATVAAVQRRWTEVLGDLARLAPRARRPLRSVSHTRPHEARP
jgi:hypothetical protein